MERMFKHTGKGHYMGSAVIVIAKNIVLAENIIRQELDNMGLKDEPLNVTEIMFEDTHIIYSQNGDY